MTSTKFVPVEIRENQDEIAKIADRAKQVLVEEHNINVTDSQGIVTIAYAFLKQAAVFLSERKAPGTDVSINLMDLIQMGIGYREGDGEKEGNYAPYALPGQELKLLAKDDNDTEE